MTLPACKLWKRRSLNLEARGIRIILCEPKDYLDDFATAIDWCNLLVGTNPNMAQEKRVILNEHTERMPKTSESYLSGAPNDSSWVSWEVKSFTWCLSIPLNQSGF